MGKNEKKCSRIIAQNTRKTKAKDLYKNTIKNIGKFYKEISEINAETPRSFN